MVLALWADTLRPAFVPPENMRFLLLPGVRSSKLFGNAA
jgi:hypothetical protein